MKCKNCGKELQEVNVFSEARQIASVDATGKITEYGSVEDISDEATDAECPHCGDSVKEQITAW